MVPSTVKSYFSGPFFKRSNQIIDDVVFLCDYDTVVNVAQNDGVGAQKNAGVHSGLNWFEHLRKGHEAQDYVKS